MDKETLNAKNGSHSAALWTRKVNGLLISKILAKNVNYDKAKEILAAAGHGWRMPTLAEFFEILERVGKDGLAEAVGTTTPTMTDIFVQSIDREDDISTISIDGRHLACNICNAAKERGMGDWFADVVLVKTDIGERSFKFAQRFANEASEEIKQLLKSYNVIGLDFDKYRGKCRIEDYDYIVQTDYDYDDNSLCGIYLKDDTLYVAESNGSDLYLDSYRCDLEVELYELVKTIFEQVDNGELELYEYPEDNI